MAATPDTSMDGFDELMMSRALSMSQMDMLPETGGSVGGTDMCDALCPCLAWPAWPLVVHFPQQKPPISR